MTDTEILNWLEAELKRGKRIDATMCYNPFVSGRTLLEHVNGGYGDTFDFFTVHSQHLKAKSLREAVETAAKMKRIL